MFCGFVGSLCKDSISTFNQIFFQNTHGVPFFFSYFSHQNAMRTAVKAVTERRICFVESRRSLERFIARVLIITPSKFDYIVYKVCFGNGH